MPGFQHCSWCHGKGCMCCDTEQKRWEAARDREYERQFPNGPQPMFTARRDNPNDMAAMGRILDAALSGGRLTGLESALLSQLCDTQAEVDAVGRQIGGLRAAEEQAAIERAAQLEKGNKAQ